MIAAIIAVSLFGLWLLGAFGVYNIGWPYHAILVISVVLIFAAGVHGKKPEISDIMTNNNLLRSEAEQVKKIMDKNKLNEQEAIELLRIRSKSHFVNSDLMQTRTKQVRMIMSKNHLSSREAAELLNIRLKLHNK